MTSFVITKKVKVYNIPFSEYEGFKPSYTPDYYQKFKDDRLINRFSGLKKRVVELLIEGHSFYGISKKTGVDKMKIYKIRDELKMDLKDIYYKNQYEKEDLKTFCAHVKQISRQIGLADFAYGYLNTYDPEAQNFNWKIVPLQDVYYKIWNDNPKSCIKAPREHLKTTSVLQYLIKRMFEREYPLEIYYFHLNKDIAVEKIRKMQVMIQRNPLLASSLKIDQAQSWRDGEIRLLDGTKVKGASYHSGTVGRHPHIIVLDDIIDKDVIYSDVKNKKAISKFYSDIYPMITKAGNDKKIIVIGTAQREDDIYEKLPEDFKSVTFKAILDEDEKKVLEPNLFTYDELMKVKKDMSEQFGEKFFLKEYQNEPFSSMGLIIEPAWIRYYQDVNIDELDIYQGWDLSVGKDIEKGDYTACATIGIKKEDNKIIIYILDVYRARIKFGKRLDAVVELANKWKPLAIGIEQNVFQYDTVNTLQTQTNYPIQGIKTVNNKVQKFRTDLAPHFENGKVYMKKEMKDLKKELLSLPTGVNDDMADALTIAIDLSNQFESEVMFGFA